VFDIRIKDDVFALGVVLYEIAIGTRIWDGKEDREVRISYEKGGFPDVSQLDTKLAMIIKKCWNDEYETADEIMVDFAQ
jgi:hypothetical protein